MDLLRAPVNVLDHISGLRNAPVVMIEYGDYECPYCVAAHEVVKEIQSLFGESLCFIFRNFPLTNEHPHAFDAAALAELAATQDKFWEVHDALYERSDNLSFQLLESMAKSFDISLIDFREAHLNKKILKKIQGDADGGIQSGVRGTPTFFINGSRYEGSFEAHAVSAFINDHVLPHGDGGKPIHPSGVHPT
jgi:protein-disulfide isomerase